MRYSPIRASRGWRRLLVEGDVEAKAAPKAAESLDRLPEVESYFAADVEADKAEKAAIESIVPREFLDMFRLGGWFRRLPRIDPAAGRPPNRGSQRPADIDTLIWAAVCPLVQARERACREAEEIGEGPPVIP